MGDWIKEMWDIHTIEYYLAIRKDEILPFATTWMDLGNITLSEISKKINCYPVLNFQQLPY